MSKKLSKSKYVKEYKPDIDKNEVYISKVLQKKSIHIALTTGTHGSFKSECAKRSLSMQEVIERFANLIANEDFRFIKFLDKMQEDKLLGIAYNTELKKSQVEDIYDILERDNPFND